MLYFKHLLVEYRKYLKKEKNTEYQTFNGTYTKFKDTITNKFLKSNCEFFTVIRSKAPVKLKNCQAVKNKPQLWIELILLFLL